MGGRQSVSGGREGQSTSVNNSSSVDNPGPSTSVLQVSTRQSRSLSVPTNQEQSRPVSVGSGQLQRRLLAAGASSEQGTLWPVLEQLISRRAHTTSSLHLPPHLPLALKFFDLTCPVCGKTVPSDEAECHLVMCLTRPRLTYNEDVLLEDKGECVICLEELTPGDSIARLPCLCIYHKKCIDDWFHVRNSCPEHPGDE